MPRDEEVAFTIPIMAFPPELRTAIFAYAVTFPKIFARPDDIGSEEPVAIDLPILVVNKAVYEEAAPLFYEHNTFRFILPSQLPPQRVVGRTTARRTVQNDTPVYDIQVECQKALTVPARFIDRLRHVVFHKPLRGVWPNGPLTNSMLGPDGLGEAELATMLDHIAANNGILTSIAVELQRQSPVAIIEWDEDPLKLLKELDREERFSRIAARLAQLKRLEIWKGRTCSVGYMLHAGGFPPGGLEKGEVYVAEVKEAKLAEIAENHFRDKELKSARYERKAWGDYLEKQVPDSNLFMKEGFVLNFASLIA